MRTSIFLLFQDLILCGRYIAFVAFFVTFATTLAALIMSLSLAFVPLNALAVQSVPLLMNFQGRLTDNNGNALPDGSYNIKLRLFTSPSGGAAVWEEDRVYGVSDNRIELTSGLFNVQLGGVTSLPASLFNEASQGQLYLEVELPAPATATCASNGCASWSEGPMTPRQQLATAGYAFNSDTLDGIDSSGFVQLSPATQQSGYINIDGSLSAGGALQGSSASLTATNSLTLGTAHGATGQVTFENGSNTNAVVLQAGNTGPPTLTLTLPTALGSSGDCLKDTSGSGLLGFGSCGSSTTLQTAYDNSTGPPSITTSSAGKGFIIQSGTSNNSSQAFAVIPDGTVIPTIDVDTQNNRVGIGTDSPVETLDVAGGIKLGDTSGSNAGTIRFNGTSFQGYDGSNWLSLGSAAATNVVANQVVTAYKTTDQSRTNTAAFANDTELYFTIGAGEKWDYHYFIDGSSGTTPDFKFSITAPSGATCNWAAGEAENSESVAGLACGASSGVMSGSGANDEYTIDGWVQAGATGGNVTLQWAQNTANASATVVRAGSFVQATQDSGGSLNPFILGGNSFGATAVLGTADANDLSLITNGTERVRINSSGNVGIGVAPSSARLNVGGTLNLTSGSQYQINGNQIDTSALSDAASITMQGNSFNGASQLLQLNASAALPAVNGSNLTGLNPSNLATGSGAISLASGGSGGLTLTAASGTISLGSATLQRAGPSLTFDLATAATSQLSIINSNGSNLANLNVEGGLTIGSGQAVTVGAAAGTSVSCSGGQVLQNQVVTGGVVTGGSCTTVSGGGSGDLQAAYTASSSPAAISLANAKNFLITATDQTTDPNVLINLACVTCSAGGGRFAVQDGGVDVLGVLPAGGVSLAPSAGQDVAVNLAGSSTLALTATSAPTTDQLSIDNTGTTGTATTNANGLHINYLGGGVAAEASGERIDLTPGGTSGGTWNGLKIVAASTGPASGVTENGLSLTGPTSSGSGTATAIKVTTGWDIGLAIDNGGLDLGSETSTPDIPQSGHLRVYAKQVAGRTMLKAMGSSGVDYALQPSLFQQNVVLITGGNGTANNTYTTIGSNVTASGTLAAQSGSSSEALGNTSRIATGTTAGTAAGFYTKNVYYRGSIANGADGYFYFIRANFSNTLSSYTNATTGSRVFLGLCGSTFTTCATSDTPTTANASGFVFSGSAGDTNFQFIDCNGSACSSRIDTGVALNVTDTFDFYFYCQPGGSTVNWRIDDLTTGAAPVEGSTTSDLPTASAPLNVGAMITNLSGANRFLYFQRLYFETDR